jgi:hypothetical protein
MWGNFFDESVGIFTRNLGNNSTNEVIFLNSQEVCASPFLRNSWRKTAKYNLLGIKLDTDD